MIDCDATVLGASQIGPRVLAGAHACRLNTNRRSSRRAAPPLAVRARPLNALFPIAFPPFPCFNYLFPSFIADEPLLAAPPLAAPVRPPREFPCMFPCFGTFLKCSLACAHVWLPVLYSAPLPVLSPGRHELPLHAVPERSFSALFPSFSHFDLCSLLTQAGWIQ